MSVECVQKLSSLVKLYSAILLHNIIMYQIALHCVILYYVILYYIMLYYIIITILYYIMRSPQVNTKKSTS